MNKGVIATGTLVLYQSWPMLEALVKNRGIPGPVPLPFVGNLLPLLKNQNLHEVYENWEKVHGHTYKWFMGNGMVIVTSDLPTVREIGLRKFSNFTNHMKVPDKFEPLLPGELVGMAKYSMDNSRDLYWKGLRSTANSIFHNVEVMSNFCPFMKATAKELCERIGEAKEGEAIDIWRALGDMTLDVIGSTVFGCRFDCIRGKGNDAVKAARIIFKVNIASFSWNPYLAIGMLCPKFMLPLLTFLSKRFPTGAMKEVEWAVNTLARLSEAMVDDANKEIANGGDGGNHNLLKLFVKAHNRETGDPLGTDEVKAQAFLYLLAGYETTANTLAYSVYLLSTNPEKEEKLIEEIDRLSGSGQESFQDLKSYVYTEGVVKEALRLFGPIPLTDRQASEPMQLKNFKVDTDQVIHISTRMMHRNREYFPSPEEFMPERFVKGSEVFDEQEHRAFVPWGLGPRMCVAADFALMEAKLALITLYKRFRFEYNKAKKFEVSFGASLSPVNGIEVFVHPR